MLIILMALNIFFEVISHQMDGHCGFLSYGGFGRSTPEKKTQEKWTLSGGPKITFAVQKAESQGVSKALTSYRMNKFNFLKDPWIH